MKNLIIEGKIKKGERLPSEDQLSDKYFVSRGTIRKSIEVLVDENLVKKFKEKELLLKKNNQVILSDKC